MPHRLDLFPNNELIGHYRKIFSSKEGQEVLAHMLVELGVFMPVTDGPEDIALKNHGIRLIDILAGQPTEHGGGPAKDNVKNFMDRVMKQPLPKEQDGTRD